MLRLVVVFPLLETIHQWWAIPCQHSLGSRLLVLLQVVTLAALLTRCGAVTVLAASYFLACVVLSAGAVRRPNWNRNRWRWQLPVHSETSGTNYPQGGVGLGVPFGRGLGHAAQGVGL